MRILGLVLAAASMATACSSSTSETPSVDDVGVAADTGSPAPDTGPATMDTGGTCTGLSGTYDCTRKRSASVPGSCDPTYKFVAAMPVKVTADAAAASGYRIEVGYTSEAGAVTFVPCTNNVSGCTIFATCLPDAGTDEVALTIDGNRVSGTLKRANKSPACTVNFDLTGTRK